MKIIIILFFVIIYSCSSNEKNYQVARSKDYYDLTDHSGNFTLLREKGRVKQGKDLVVRTTIFPVDGDESKPLEKSIMLSTPGIMNKIPVYRPKLSQYFVWFEDSEERHSTKMSINLATKSLDIEIKSPEKKWNGKKSIPFPSGSGVYCFFNQLIECVRITGFFEEAIKQGAGTMNFHIIWDGYPFIQEQLLGIPDRVFEPAILSFERSERDKTYQFVLKLAGQVIFYTLDERFELVKKFWTTQGISITRRGRT